MPTKSKETRKTSKESKGSKGSKGKTLGRPPKAKLHEEIELILEPSPKVISRPPFFIGDSVRYINEKWYIDQAHMFRTIVLPYTNAFAAYSAWIAKDVAKYYCHILLNDDIDFEIERGYMGVCVLHEECRVRNGRSDACLFCLASKCFCTKVISVTTVPESAHPDIFQGSLDMDTVATKKISLTAKDLIMQERERAFTGQIGAFSTEVQRTMCCEFWDSLFKAEEMEAAENKSTVQAQMLWKAWARRRHGLFFLREIYNLSVTSAAAIPTHWEAPPPPTLLV